MARSRGSGGDDPVSADKLVQELRRRVNASGKSPAEFGELIGWDVAPLLQDPGALWSWNLDGLRDVCAFCGLEWAALLAEIPLAKTRRVMNVDAISALGSEDANFSGFSWENDGKRFLRLLLAHASLPIAGLLCYWTSKLRNRPALALTGRERRPPAASPRRSAADLHGAPRPHR